MLDLPFFLMKTFTSVLVLFDLSIQPFNFPFELSDLTQDIFFLTSFLADDLIVDNKRLCHLAQCCRVVDCESRLVRSGDGFLLFFLVLSIKKVESLSDHFLVNVVGLFC